MTYAEDLRRAHKERQARFTAAALKAVTIPITEKHVEPAPITVRERILTPAAMRESAATPSPIELTSDEAWITEILFSTPPKIQEIKRLVCETYGISRTKIEGPMRHAKIMHPRQIAVHLCAQHTGRSYPYIGKWFGDRDHTTALHADHKLAARRKIDAELNAELVALEKQMGVEFKDHRRTKGGPKPV